MTFFINGPKLPAGPPHLEIGKAHHAQRAPARPVPVTRLLA
jgi:hypothetical protein